MRYVERATAVGFLRTVPVFARLREEELAFLAQNARCERRPRGTTLFQQSAPANELWLVQQGGVKLMQQQGSARRFAVRVVGPLGVVGLDMVAQHAAYSVTAETLCWSGLMVWTRSAVRRVMESNSALAVGAMQVLSHRIEDFRGRYRELTTERAETRIARAVFRAFCEWSRATPETGVGNGNGNGKSLPIDLPLSRRDLADLAGTTLYTASRVVQDWERRGFLHAGRMRITLLQPTALPLASVHRHSGNGRHSGTPDVDDGGTSNVAAPLH